MLHCHADGKGGQTIKNTGPLTKKRMETIDEETTELAIDFIERQVAEDKPFFVWYNTTAMHYRTHPADKHRGKSGQGDYNDVMVAHDEHIGEMLDLLDRLGIADDTIVMYSTDNGPHYNTWPDAGITPFRSEKNTNWEGGWRVPCFLRWPGQIPAGSVVNGIVSHQDMLPTLLAAAGDADISTKLLTGHTIGNMTYKVHIDGLNMLPYLTGAVARKARALPSSISATTAKCWASASATTNACWPSSGNADAVLGRALRQVAHAQAVQPAARSVRAGRRQFQHLLGLVPEPHLVVYKMQDLVASMIPAFVAYPPRQTPASFNLDGVMKHLQDAGGGAHH